MSNLTTIIKIIPVIILAVLIIFACYFALYKSIVKFFGVVSPVIKKLLIGILIFLSVAFILSTLWSRFQDNLFIRIFYIFSGIWYGLFLYLLIASLGVWIIIWILKAAGVQVNITPIASIAFILALSYTAWGVWNAFHPIVKNIEVNIKNLPSQWQGKTIVQLSDVHLGHVHRPAFMKRIAEDTNALKPDIIFITGDLFDGMGDSLIDFVEPINELQAPEGIYFVTGNHETYLGLQKAYSILAKTKIKILNNELVNIDGLQIIGLSYPALGEEKNIKSSIAALKDFDPSGPSILLYHSPYPSSIKQAKEAGINLQLSGHTHQGQVFPFEFISWLVYQGFDYGLHKGGNFSEYTTNGQGTWGPPLRTGNTPEIPFIKLESSP